MMDNTDRGNIFIWGNFGKKLQKLDNERYLAITQNSPDEFLSRIYNNKMEKIISKIDNGDIDLIFDEMEKENDLDNLFRQVASFMRGNSDMISIGSLLTGELEKSVKTGRIVKKRIKGDIENEKDENENNS